MLRFNLIPSILLSGLIALMVSNTSQAGGVSVYFAFQPMQREVMMPQQVYMDCYTQGAVIYHGRVYGGQRVCERNVVSRTTWIEAGRSQHHHHRFW